MKIDEIKEKYLGSIGDKNLSLLKLGDKVSINTYPNSLNKYKETLFFIGQEKNFKGLFILCFKQQEPLTSGFEGRVIKESLFEENLCIKKCSMSHKNVKELQKLFIFTNPAITGLVNSYGFGDRLGVANPGHVRSLKGSDFIPVFAQQSIRELTRTHRTADEVMDAAVWAVFQEGYKGKWGADADHLKTEQDIDRMYKAGYKTFTFDPSDYIFQGVEKLSNEKAVEKFNTLPWKELRDNPDEIKNRYTKKDIEISKGFEIHAEEKNVVNAAIKYSRAFLHIKKLFDFLSGNFEKGSYEVEVSIDETDTVTTPFEHYFIVNELKRLKVEFVSLAPRFVGGFEKGIDYKGDIELFKKEYLKHIQITEYFGFYKLSIHSGSDKFAVYGAVAQINKGYVHVKTAGTSYLEALKVVAIKNPGLFREILDFSKSLYDTEKATYHVSASVDNVKDGKLYKEEELLGLMSIDDPRQILHVAFGRVLTEKNENGEYLYRDKILACLRENEELYYELLIKHFHKHLDPFKKTN